VDLFDYNAETQNIYNSPLSRRVRPRNLNEFFGQSHLISDKSVIKTSIDRKVIPSMILWGAPGVGKTTLANIIANSSNHKLETINAVKSGVESIRKATIKSRENLGTQNLKTIIFIDEIHHFSRNQQESLLNIIEDGLATIIGATTEDPGRTLIGPIISRCRVFKLKHLEFPEIKNLLKNVLRDPRSRLHEKHIEISDENLKTLISKTSNDVRIILDTIELACQDNQKSIIITKNKINNILQTELNTSYNNDNYYNLISALIKSIRGSDVDASVYWLARLIDTGINPEIIGRRLVISASEDIGLGDPLALTIASSALESVSRIGWPEARIILSQTTIYLAKAPKNNSSYLAIQLALEEVNKPIKYDVPLHLRNSTNSVSKRFNYGKGYENPHNNLLENKIEYLPKKLRGKKFFNEQSSI
tara:strand:+ start:16915 stop:18171 length:1257 start_codon:yes stop_codon:yes gene_type:complete